MGNSRGSILIQVLVGFALAAIVGTALVTLMVNMAQLQQVVMQRSEASEVARLVSMYLSDGDFCTKNLVSKPSGGAGYPVSRLNGGVKIANLQNGTGPVLYEAGTKAGLASSLTLSEMTVRPLADGPAPTATLAAGQLDIVFETPLRMGGGIKIQSIPVMFRIKDGLIKSCQAYSTEAGPTQVQECRPGQFVRGANDTGDLICADFPSSSCPTGGFAVGVDNSGRVVCDVPKLPHFHWVQASAWKGFGSPFESIDEACARMGLDPSPPPNCTSGEVRLSGDDDTDGLDRINYVYGVWGGSGTGGGSASGMFCYRPGQKKDGDGTDLIVGYRCQRK